MDGSRQGDGDARAEGRAGSLAACDAAMTRYAAGDEAAFAIVYDGLATRLYGFLARQTGDTARAEDVLQQTFLLMHRARDTFVPRSCLGRSRSRGACSPTRTAAGRAKCCKRATRATSGSQGSRARTISSRRRSSSRIQRELDRLPEAQRHAFELVKREGLSFAEAADALGTTVTGVKLRMHRAYEALRDVLGRKEERT